MKNHVELSPEQRRHLIDLQQIYEVELQAARHALTYVNGMTWKKANGREYLFRLSGRRGYGKSLGPRTPETEAVLARFQEGKREAGERLRAVRTEAELRARIAKAVGLGRVPRTVARLLRLLDERSLLGKDVLVLGTHCLFAYESVAGVHFSAQVSTTRDIDLLFDARRRLSMSASKLDPGGMLALLKRADPSFEPMTAAPFRAANRQGFMVDLITAPLEMRHAPVQLAEGDLVAAEIPGLQWLVSAPRVRAVAAADDGTAAPFVAPDPRAFAVHKAWLSARPDRDPLKRPRDAAQAAAVLACVREFLPHLRLDAALLKSFPLDVALGALPAGGK